MRKYAFLLASLLAVACVKDNLDTTIPANDSTALSLTASAPESPLDTKTQISDDLSVSWNSEDQIKVCFPVNFSLYNNTGKTINGVSAVFTTSSEDGASSAVFSCESWNVDLNEVTNSTNRYNEVGYAFYPTSVDFSHAVSNYNYGKDNSVSASYTIPSVQNAIEGTFERNLNPAYAVVDKGELLAGTADATFHNLAALVKISLSENIDNVKEIRINTANASPYTVCGTVNFNISSDNENPSVWTSLESMSDPTPVILKKADGTNLQAGQTYYAVIAPGRTHVGIKLTFVHANGAMVEKVVKFDNYWEVKAADCWTINVKNPIVFPEPTVLEVDSEIFDASYAVDTKTFNVNANFDWAVAITSFNTSWLKVSPAAGTGNGTFTITTEENPDLFNTRSAQLTLTSKEKSIVINVTQDYKKYYLVSQVEKAEDLAHEGSYAIRFADWTGGYYFWNTTADGYTTYRQNDNQDQVFTVDYVYQFETLSGYTIAPPFGSFESVHAGVFKSLRNGMYYDYAQQDFVSSEPTNDNVQYTPFIVCSNSDGSTTPHMWIWDWLGVGYLYYSQYYSHLYYSSNPSDTYCWYIYKVELR